MKALLIAAALAAGPALADEYVFRTKDVVVRLSDKPCTSKVSQFIKEAAVPMFRQATVVFRGKDLLACWTLEGEVVLLIDEDGDAGQLPAAAFKVEKGV